MTTSSLNLKLLVLSILLAGASLVALTTRVRAKDAASGATLYDQKCAMCHAKDGSANTPMGKGMKIPDLRSGEVQKLSNAQLEDVIAKGKGMMPGYSSQLKPEQIHELVAYIRTLAKKK